MFIFDSLISEKKRIDLSLLVCFGIGKNTSRNLLAKLGSNLSNNKKIRLKKLDFFIPLIIKKRIIERKVGLSLKQFLFFRMRDIKKLKNYRSYRHSLFLPVRGQRTKTNAQSQKNKRKGRKRLAVPRKKKR